MKAIFCFLIIAALGLGQPVPPVPPAPPAPPADVRPPVPPAPPWPPQVWGDFDSFARFKDFEKFGRSFDKFDMHLPKLAMQFDMLAKPHLLDHAFQLSFQGRSRAEEQAERQYERGMRSLDKRQFDEAIAQFDEAAAGKSRADGAMYWKAYAMMRLGRGKEALAVLDDMAKSHPQSAWLNDAKAMRVEIAQAAGRPVSPEDSSDDEIKVMAINALMQTDSERAIPLLEKLLVSKSSPKLRERALFVLSQSNSPKAREVLAKVAKGGLNPDLQIIAVRTLGVQGGKENRQALADIYASTSDLGVKKQILNSFMVSGERDRLLAIAKSDPTPELRMGAIRYLGNLGANSQLASLYASESSVEIRSRILQSMFEAGNTEKLIEVAKTEKEPALRERAIRHLGSMSTNVSGAALVEIYGNSTDPDTRKRILNALFSQGNAQQLIACARKETNSDLRRAAVQYLTNMRSKEATDFLMEILNK
jgi:HEAT repeat protein